MKHFDGIYTVTMDEAQACKFERADKLISIDSPLVSILLMIGFVAVLSLNGLYA